MPLALPPEVQERLGQVEGYQEYDKTFTVTLTKQWPPLNLNAGIKSAINCNQILLAPQYHNSTQDTSVNKFNSVITITFMLAQFDPRGR